MTDRTARYLEISGPAENAAAWLADNAWRIIQVDGSNGCDFKNETAEEYIVYVEDAHLRNSFGKDSNYVWNLKTLKAYHEGDHEHYLAELRRDLVGHVRHYAQEATGLHPLIVSARLNTQIADLISTLDEIVDNNQSTSTEVK